MLGLKSEIISFFNKDISDVFFYWKGRVALYALLQAMGVGEEDEVILPAYTCVVVPNAILYLGAKPVYVDVSSVTYNMDIGQVENAITERTKVIICQNTYGLSTDLEKLDELAKKYKLYTIEDCTHGFGGTYNNLPNGLYCDAAIYSTQWNKPFSTGIGGFSITKDKKIARRLVEFKAKLMPPLKRERWNLRFLYFVKRYLINKVTYWPLVHFYRWLSHNTPVVGSSSIEEINSTSMPKGYLKGFSETQAKEGLRNLNDFKECLERRKKNALIYTDFLVGLKKNHVDKKYFANHSFLKYPLLVTDRDKFMSLAESSRIELGEWFVSQLHPVGGDLSAWKFDVNKFPIAQYLSSHVVNLPTTLHNVQRVISFLIKNSEYILNTDDLPKIDGDD